MLIPIFPPRCLSLLSRHVPSRNLEHNMVTREHHGLGDPKVDDRLMNKMKQAGEVKFKEQQKEGDLPKDQTEINLLWILDDWSMNLWISIKLNRWNIAKMPEVLLWLKNLRCGRIELKGRCLVHRVWFSSEERRVFLQIPQHIDYGGIPFPAVRMAGKILVMHVPVSLWPRRNIRKQKFAQTCHWKENDMLRSDMPKGETLAMKLQGPSDDWWDCKDETMAMHAI